MGYLEEHRLARRIERLEKRVSNLEDQLNMAMKAIKTLQEWRVEQLNTEIASLVSRLE